jgi:transketolase
MNSLRGIFAKIMCEVGATNNNLVVMVGDISHGILSEFRKNYPERYFNIGINEPAMISISAGLSKVGLIPVVHTIAPFLVERTYEQIKIDFAYQNLGGNLISVGSAFDYSKLGCSHHSYSDVSLMASLPNSQIFIPGSEVEFEVLFKYSYTQEKINYFRLTENSHGVNFGPNEIIPEKGIKIRNGKDITFVTIGATLKDVLIASDTLLQLGFDCEVIYLHTFKPFDSKIVRESVEKTRKFLTIEELSSHDGLYNQVLKSVYEIDGVRGGQLAINDFLRFYGTYKELRSVARLDAESIIQKSLTLLNP